MNLFTLILIGGLSAYAQQGHSGGSMGHAASPSGGISSPIGGLHGQGENAENSHADKTEVRSIEQGRASQQSPDAVLERNTKLSSKLDGLLPTGTTAQRACSGFKTLGDCVSAIHVSHNLEIPFAELKGKLTGNTPEKLGKAIQDLKPGVDAKEEVKKAKKQGKSDLETAAPVS